MRGCLFVLLLAAVFALGAAWFAAPPVAGFLVESALSGAGFAGRGTSVTVTSEPPIEVLTGHADRVRIVTNDGRFGRFEATRIELTLTDVDLVRRSFGELDGRLDGVRVRQEDRIIPIRRLDLAGPAHETEAVATIAGADVERLASDAINDRLGLPVASTELVEPNRLRLSVAGRVAEARFVVDPDGSLTLALPLSGEPRIVIVEDDPVRLRSATVVDGDLVLTGTFDADALIGG